MPNVNTNPGAHEGPSSRQFDRKSGWTSTRHFEGTQSEMLAQELAMISLGYSTTITQGAVWKLDASVPARDDGGNGGQGDQPIDTWELFPNVVEKDLLQSDSAAVAKLSKQHVAFMRDVLDGKISANKYASSDPVEFGSNLGAGSDPVGVFRLILSGWKSKRIYQQMLRHTKTIANSYQVPASLAHVGEVYSTARLLADEPVFPIIAGSLEASSYITRNDGVLLYKGWLKAFPYITDSAYGKSQIVQEWERGDFAALGYTIYP